MIGPYRTFEDYWSTFSIERQLKFNKLDAMAGWMASSLNVDPARLEGRRQAFELVIKELEKRKKLQEKELVNDLYKKDVSYIEE